MRRRLPPLNALRAFEASARLGSFVAAGAELRVSAAAVSQQVRRLERYLDAPLFQRLARGLVLTEQGRDWLPELTHLPSSIIHRPWTATPAQLATAGVELGVTYPHRLVDHAVARDRALSAFRNLKKAA